MATYWGGPSILGLVDHRPLSPVGWGVRDGVLGGYGGEECPPPPHVRASVGWLPPDAQNFPAPPLYGG